MCRNTTPPETLYRRIALCGPSPDREQSGIRLRATRNERRSPLPLSQNARCYRAEVFTTSAAFPLKEGWFHEYFLRPPILPPAKVHASRMSECGGRL
jgi:hypothetical protein